MNKETKPHTDRAWLTETIMVAGVVTALAHLYFNAFGTLPENWIAALHFGMFGVITALTVPTFQNKELHRSAFDLWFSIALGVLTLACAVYLMLAENALYERGVSFSDADWGFSILAVLLALEFARRASGWVIPILIVVSLSYVALWGQWIGGPFAFPGLSMETILYRSYFGTDGMFGPIANISWSFVFMFILFGAFLVRSGAGDYIIRLAQAAAGRVHGGPGLVAVISSGLMGSVSGSAIANTVATGVITIPTMRRAGFPPKFAAGVEAAASTGGQLMPPVMGAGAFIMASFTGTSYLTILSVALLPAVLYFLSVAFFVRIEAQRLNLPLGDESTDGFVATLVSGWVYLLPIAVLVALLVYGFTPTYAAAVSIAAVVIASWFTPNRMDLAAVVEALVNGTKTMAPTAMLLIAVGIVVNVISTTGVGNTFSLMITSWAGGSLLLTIALVAIASLVLGMGLPVTAAYVVLATLAAPAISELIIQAQLIEQIASGSVSESARALFMLVDPSAAASLGTPMSLADAEALVALIPSDMTRLTAESILEPEFLVGALLAAHLIIFWVSQDSNVTPPVCLTAFAAASIAGTPPMATGLMAWKLAKGLYIVPILLAFTPLVWGSLTEALVVFVFGAFGLYAAAGVFQGHLEGPLSLQWRLILFGAATFLLVPHGILGLSLAGLVLLTMAFVFSLRAHERETHPTAS